MYDNDPTSPPRIDPDWGAVRIGTPVLASDGTQLGTVTEKREDGLLVGGTDGQGEDYMVTAQDLGRIDEQGVHLIVNPQQAMRAHWQGTSPDDEQAPGGMAPGAMTRDYPTP